MTAQQLAHLGIGKCKVEGCNNLTSEVYCARCEEEITAQYYSLANVLNEFPPINRKIVFYAAVLIVLALGAWICR